MRRAVLVLPALALALTAACSTPRPQVRAVPVYTPPQGINEVMNGPIASDFGHSLIVGDLNMAPGAAIPRHFHHGEEYIYLLGGSATVSRAGHPDTVLRPGEGLIVNPGVVHWGVAGPEGMRAISVWVKDDSRPLREMVAE